MNEEKISGTIAVTGTINGTITIGGGSAPVLQEKTVTPRRSEQVVTPDTGYDALSQVTVNATPLQLGVIAYPNEDGFVVEPEQGYVGLRRVSVAPVPLQSKTITPNSTTQHILPDSGYYGLEAVDVLPGGNDRLPDALLGGLVNATINGSGAMGLNIQNIVAPDATSIRDYGFSYNKNLVSFSGANVGTVGTYAFYYDDNLTTVSLPECTAIGDNAFAMCNALLSVSIPKCVSVGEGSFSADTSLTDVSLPECVEIKKNGFNNCYNLQSLSLPKVTSIGNNGFKCSTASPSITALRLPKCTSIGTSAFSKWTNLTDVYLGASTVCSWDTSSSSSSPWYNSGVLGSNGKIHVPAELLSQYQSTYGSISSHFVGDYDA